ncbi:hypothetical protein BX616_006285 [Lobosporangium transversale]|uniref:Uncharacterized protein n=1 Tax=Lobosporangium transversale TaxID=64571 RepID=A0A1Y2GBR7_9FUNG|nr:hypothetical protein BCR41DRAFT_400667 [Lobosporangium transversale]KAF9915378.1 hypothetical protein BX616_006285 [Lobosporangium transversale]ORZ05125.1 hypothetical protein BCR41DRAFT_400667 [Lobosporangium transversale]|eukprot:XP_021876900.1 hypothetical protein BCR41DRAFT_400667 [Lobosporangium transversale]
MDVASQSTTRKSNLRNLQPRAAAAIDFNDSDDDDCNPLSADYKAQRETTKDLVDFFKNAPPPSSPATTPLSSIVVDEKKKRTLLQRLRSRKANLPMGGSTRGRNVVLAPSLQSSSSSLGSHSRVGSEVAILPNGKKYVMIAVDYKDSKDAGAGPGLTHTVPSSLSSSNVGRLPGLTSPKRLNFNNVGDDSGSKRESTLNKKPSIQLTTAIEGRTDTNNSMETSKVSNGADKHRSIAIQAGSGEGSNFILDSSPFMLDNFALNPEYVTKTGTAQTQLNGQQADDTANVVRPRTHHSSKSSQYQSSNDSGSKRSTRVTFNIADQPQEQPSQQPLSKEALSKALAGRISKHKAQTAKGMLLEETGNTRSNGYSTKTKTTVPEVILPKPVTRKKVRHVQIQTQHCVTRPMYTQTEPLGSLAQDYEAKEFATQTGSSRRVSGTTDVGMSTDSESTIISPPRSSPTKGSMASTSIATTATDTKDQGFSTLDAATNTTFNNSTFSTVAKVSGMTENEELVFLRQQNSALQVQVAMLQRDLAAETRARTRTAVAMQDTRDKFEMLSAMAYKKLKEMIFQRHVLEMEVRELRAQVDMHNEEAMYPTEVHHEYITVNLQQ